MTVIEIKGSKSLRAINAFITLVTGLKMLPEYQKISIWPFLAAIAELDTDGQATMLREAALIVPIEDEEIFALAHFCQDQNGVRYSRENVNGLGPGQIIDLIVAVCLEIIKLKVHLVSESEKKNSVTTLST